MTKQPEALRLADALTAPYTEVNREAAAELRRLHEVNAELLAALKRMLLDGNCIDTNYQRLAINQAKKAVDKATGETE